jgi:Pentapeptide repeats (8 copies)
MVPRAGPAIAIAIAFACLVAFLAWIYVAPATTAEKKDFLQLITQIFGGIVLLVSLIFTWWNLNLTQRAANQNLENAHETLKVTQEGQVTDRFLRAVEQLGNKDKIELRLGAIYSLERISRTSEVDYWPIIELVCAFLRSNAPVSGKETRAAASKRTPSNKTRIRDREDIQAAISMIGRRHRAGKEELGNIYLASVDLSNLHLEQVNLVGAILWLSSLEGSVLWGADLRRASLTGVSLRNANLTEAHLENAFLSGSDMEGADLTRAHLEGAYMLGVDGLTFQQLESAYINEETKLPDHVSKRQRDTLLARSRSAEQQEIEARRRSLEAAGNALARSRLAAQQKD